MEPVIWNTLLFIGKWIFIGLVYLILFVVLLAVRREMGLRFGEDRRSASVAPGRLRLVRGGSDPRLQPGTVLPLQFETRLGAAQGNDIVLADRFISGQHARLRWDGVSWWVEDLGSRNGTFVNQVPVPPNQPQTILPGVLLTIGGMAFEFLE